MDECLNGVCHAGKHHGVVTRVVQVEGRAMAVVKMTDFNKGKLHVQVKAYSSRGERRGIWIHSTAS